MKYLDLIAYPLSMLAVYILIGFLNWNHNPEYWDQAARGLWILWGLLWGWAFQCRIQRGGTP
jgi:hypothetical protein